MRISVRVLAFASVSETVRAHASASVRVSMSLCIRMSKRISLFIKSNRSKMEKYRVKALIKRLKVDKAI